MNKCLLCLIKDADETGSHIVPHFLMKRIENAPGDKERDKEIGFVIKKGFTSSHFGRAVQPKKLEEIYGEVTDELIESNTNDIVVDNYFCKTCEKRLAAIENEYSKTIGSKTETNANFISEKRPFLGFLFWISIVWRLSIQENSGFKLKQKEERKLGRILNSYLNTDIKQIKPDPSDPDLANIGYKLLRAPNYSDNNSTWLHWSHIYERPYSFIIDEYLFFLYFKKNHMKGMTLDFYGSEPLKKKAIFNTAFSSESVYGMEHQEHKEVGERMIFFSVQTRLNALSELLDNLHRESGQKGKHMPTDLKNEIIK